MNLQKLFDTQKVLRDRIGYEGEDRFEKLILGLLVEIGECANEWRGFKFWSKDQEPRTKVRWDYSLDDEPIFRNLLLEEYVDGLHFVLEIGLETDFNIEFYIPDTQKYDDVISQFVWINRTVTDFFMGKRVYDVLLDEYIGLGEMLGFTWEEIETAYFDKNKVNHERQNTGY
ncbi:dUTP diphosphatase [Niallia circulans]